MHELNEKLPVFLYPVDTERFRAWSRSYPAPYSVIRVGGATHTLSQLPFVFVPSVALQSVPPQQDYVTPTLYEQYVVREAETSVNRCQPGDQHLLGARVMRRTGIAPANKSYDFCVVL